MQRRRFLAGAGIPVVVVSSSVVASFLGVEGARAAPGASAAAPGAAPRVIPVVARKFVFLPNDITVKKGEPVVLEFTAPEVVMGFYAPALNLRAVIVPGTPAQVAFTPDRAGRYDFLCDIFCGEGHEGMSGHLTVTD
jgi:cytochrome c oxidase subunit 2